jgi:Flp pilus assembly protein TadB
VLTALPFLVALAMYFSNPGYFAPLLQQRTGHWMIAYGIASLLVGHFIIRRLVHIKV